MTKRYTPRPGDIVTVADTLGEWLVLAPAPTAETPTLCTCNKYAFQPHRAKCPGVRRLGHYWLQCATTGALYRPNGTDEAVHKSRLTLVSAHSLPTRRELLAAELF